jgi:hypothetical protein
MRLCSAAASTAAAAAEAAAALPLLLLLLLPEPAGGSEDLKASNGHCTAAAGASPNLCRPAAAALME